MTDRLHIQQISLIEPCFRLRFADSAHTADISSIFLLAKCPIFILMTCQTGSLEVFVKHKSYIDSIQARLMGQNQNTLDF